jgi:hypothetical protein
MTEVDVLDRLVAHYASVPSPAPSAVLAARLDAGSVGVIDTDSETDARTAVVVPFTPRPRVRLRHLVAATVATFVAFSGLAIAGALPDSLQHDVASVVAHVGIDLPDPGSSPPATGTGHGSPSKQSTGKGRDGSPDKSWGLPTTVVPGGGTPSVPTTLPPTTVPGPLGVPPISTPPISTPPASTPRISVPPISIPSITLPRLGLPGL